MITPRVNPAVARLEPPPIPIVQRAAADYDGAHGPAIDLSQAVPGYPPPAPLLDALARAAAAPEALGYGAIEGERALREAWASDTNRLYGARLDARDTLITAGCNQAFAIAALAVAGPGDAVILPTPWYFNQQTTLAMLGIVPLPCPTDASAGYLPKVSSLATTITARTRAISLVTPNNPTGAVYPPELIGEVAALCAERGLWLIVDETYRDFLPDGAGAPHGLFGDEKAFRRTVGLASFSKSYCIPGHRLGAMIAVPAMIEHMAKIVDNLQICAPRPPQLALAECLPALVDWREGNRRAMAERAATLAEVVDEIQGWHVDAIGAYFAWMRHPFHAHSSREVAERLAREIGVATLPGDFFGTGNERHLRVAFANVDAERLRELPARLRAARS